MSRSLKDFLRYLKELARLFATGYGHAGKASHWLIAIAGLLGAIGLGFLAQFLTGGPIMLSASLPGSPPFAVSVPVALAVTGGIAILWFVVAVGLSAYRFRPTPALSLKLMTTMKDARFGVQNHYVQLVNESRLRVENCKVAVESVTRGLELVPASLSPAGVSLNEGETFTFDLCHAPSPLPNRVKYIQWSFVTAPPLEARDGIDVTLVATADGVSPVRITVRIGSPPPLT